MLYKLSSFLKSHNVLKGTCLDTRGIYTALNGHCDVQEMERRKFATEEEKQSKLPGIREFSRQAYLKKRQEQKLDELRDYIEDEKALFGVIHATSKISIEVIWRQ